jgi:hypothetical protein
LANFRGQFDRRSPTGWPARSPASALCCDPRDQIVAALRERGVAVEYLLKENEGHGFQNEENQIEFYEAMDRFLAKHVPVKPRAE